MKLRRRVLDYTKPDWVHSLSRTNSLQEGAGSRFGEKPLKRGNIWVWAPLFAPSFEKVWIRPRSTYEFSRVRVGKGTN
jgi:hypothetical protein